MFSQPDALRAAFEDREADICVVDSLDYVVEESQSWRGNHTKAIVLRTRLMRWPWSKTEKRESGGDFSDAVVRLIEAQAAGSAADASSTAAVEAASGALSRAFMAAEVAAEDYASQAISPVFLQQVGRDLVRLGRSMHVIDMDNQGRVSLLPCSSWHFEGDAHPDAWTVRATFYGPSTSTTRNIPLSGVVFVRWGSTPGQPYVGTGPLSWAHTTARLQSEVERSLADESAGPITNILAIPQDGGDGNDDDPLKMWKADIAAARGKATVAETTAAGWGEGKSAAPMSDFKAQRLGPNFSSVYGYGPGTGFFGRTG